MYMYIYIYIYIHIHTYIHIYVYTCRRQGASKSPRLQSVSVRTRAHPQLDPLDPCLLSHHLSFSLLIFSLLRFRLSSYYCDLVSRCFPRLDHCVTTTPSRHLHLCRFSYLIMFSNLISFCLFGFCWVLLCCCHLRTRYSGQASGRSCPYPGSLAEPGHVSTSGILVVAL